MTTETSDTRYRGEWKDWSDMIESFGLNTKDGTIVDYRGDPWPHFPTDAEVLLASCEEDSYEGSYEGSCAVFWTRDGRVYEQTFSHCSCNSYSDDLGQFEIVKPITVKYLRKQRSEGYGRGGLHAKTPENDASWTALIDRAALAERNEGRGQAEADTAKQPRGNALMPLEAGATTRDVF